MLRPRPHARAHFGQRCRLVGVGAEHAATTYVPQFVLRRHIRHPWPATDTTAIRSTVGGPHTVWWPGPKVRRAIVRRVSSRTIAIQPPVLETRVPSRAPARENRRGIALSRPPVAHAR